MPMNREQTNKYYANDLRPLKILLLATVRLLSRVYAAGCRTFSLMTAHGACLLTHAQSFSWR